MRVEIVKISDLSEGLIQEIVKYISEYKRIKINKFHKKEDKIRGICGELLARKLIIEELKIRNNDIIFDVGKYGKLFLHGRENLYFNISHSEDYVVCCLDFKEVGIDIEKIKTIDYKDIVDNFFSFKEKDYILNSNYAITLNEEKYKFYEIWTLKESYVKYTGVGLSNSLKNFSIIVNDEKSISVCHEGNTDKLYFQTKVIANEYIMSICSKGDIHKVKIGYIDQEELIGDFL